MANLPQITETPRPDWGDPVDIRGWVRLVTASAPTTNLQGTAYTNGGQAVFGYVEISYASGSLMRKDGTALTLNPNSGVSSDAIFKPTGTYWEITLMIPGRQAGPVVRNIQVPDVAGPIALSTILYPTPAAVTPPGALPTTGGTMSGQLILSNTVPYALTIPDVGGTYNALSFHGAAPDATHPQFTIRAASNAVGVFSLQQWIDGPNNAPIAWILNAGGLKVNDEAGMVDDATYASQVAFRYLTAGHRAGFALGLGQYGGQVTSGFVSGALGPAAITSVTWAANAITVTPVSPVKHPNWYVGQKVVLSGFTPSGYNGTYTIATVASDFTSFTVAQASSLGAVTGMGTVSPYWDIDAFKLDYLRADDNGNVRISSVNNLVIFGQELSLSPVSIGKVGPSGESGMSISIDGTAKLYKSATGEITSSATLVLPSTSAGAPGLYSSAASTSGVRWDGTLGLVFVGAGADAWRIGSSRNLVPASDNSFDLGSSVGPTFVRTGYIHTVNTGTATLSEFTGSPEGSVTAAAGAIRADITNGVPFAKVTGSGTSGWSKLALSASATGATGRVASTGGDLTCSSTTWAAISSSNLDIVLGSATYLPLVAGMWIEVSLSGFSGSATPGLFFDVASIVSSSPVNFVSGLANASNSSAGVQGWRCGGSTNTNLSGSVFYQLQAGDISNGTVTLRPYWVLSAAGSRSVLADSNAPLIFNARILT